MNAVIIPAAGKGERMGFGLPKQFTEVCGKPLIIHSLLVFNAYADIDEIIIGCADEYRGFLSEMCGKWGIDKLKKIVPGGATRQETVFACLSAMEGMPPDIVLIHDAARPLPIVKIITDNIKKAREYGAVNTVIPVSDTIVKSEDAASAAGVIDRAGLYNAQTPQTFKYELIMRAHKHAKEHGQEHICTDDCTLVMNMGLPVYLTEGSPFSMKITTRDDMDFFKAVMRGGLGLY